MSEILKWLSREGFIILQWWAWMTLAGLAVLPLTLRWLSRFADRGIMLARVLGLQLIGGLFWLLVNFGALTNQAGSIILCWLFVLSVCTVAFVKERKAEGENWRAWLRQNRAALICGEILFLVLLFGWALVRARIQELATTEKPMDLMMISSIMRSPTFPPNDAWLSGHAISYYYFGYLLAAALAQLSGISSALAFNLASASWLALSGITIFGLAYNLMRWRSQANGALWNGRWRRASIYAGGLLAVFFSLWMSNGHYPIVELPFQSGAASPAYLRFWDAKDRCQGSGTYAWWWFSAARAIVDRAPGYANDCDPSTHREVIAEFPAFSFLLADNHPHVFGIPVAILMMALAWHRYSSAGPPGRRDLLLYGACLAAQLATNTWDAPIYFSLLLVAEGLRRWQGDDGKRWLRCDSREMLRYSILLAAIMLLFSSPLILTIRSQASGLLANLDYPTRIQQMFVMFAPFPLLGIPFLGRVRWQGNRRAWQIAGGLILLLLLGLSLLAIVIGLLSGAGNLTQVLSAFFARRSQPIYLMSTLIPGLCAIVILRQIMTSQERSAANLARIFALFGILLLFVPEFLYLNDLFGTRMNTVFKLYYQAWLFFAIAAAWGCYRALSSGGADRLAFAGMLILVIAAGSIYLPAGVRSRIARMALASDYSLDGTRSVLSEPDRALGECLMAELAGRPAVLAEGLPVQYRQYNARYGRIATISGIPTVIAWEGHQVQWRGASYGATVGSRPADIDSLYRQEDPQQMRMFIERYGIDFIIWGSEEQLIYGIEAEQKFADHLSEFCAQELPQGRSLAYATGYRAGE